MKAFAIYLGGRFIRYVKFETWDGALTWARGVYDGHVTAAEIEPGSTFEASGDTDPWGFDPWNAPALPNIKP